MMMATTDLHMAEANWHSIYRLGAVAALLAVVFAVLEILITLLPGGERVAPELRTVPRSCSMGPSPLWLPTENRYGHLSPPA
jgi:hypothetical protein